MTKNKLNKKGFTLVELLIVIVIIGILATIGFIAFSGAQNKAKKSDADATLSQVKAKLGEYQVDNNTYPADKAAVRDFLTSDAGGNNKSLDDKFGAAGYSYACATAGCDSGFTLTAADTLWGSKPAGDLVVTN